MSLAALALAASTGAAQPTPTPTPTQSDGTLQILTYRGYAEYGGTSPKINWTGSFEKQTGCRIARLDQVQTPEELAAKAAERSYDVISAGPDLAGSLIADKRVQPIELAKVDGYGELTKRFRDMTTQGGKVYGVPYLWGSTEFVYDSTKVKKATLGKAFGSPRAALKDSPLTIADAALAATGAANPYEITKPQLGEAMALLEKQRSRTYWQNPLDLVKGFATGNLDYAQATPYLRLLLQTAGKPIKAIKTNRTTGWVDSWMLGANVPNLDCAYRWLTWTADPETQRDAAAWVGLAPANPKACKGKAERICDVYGAQKPEKLDRVTFAVRPPGDCRPQDRECTDYATWTKRWQTLVS